jgi:hypothetical protein
MPIRLSPSSPSPPARPRRSASTRLTIAPIVRQLHRSNSAAAAADICVAHHAAICSNAQVCRASCRAHGTAEVTTPCSGHDTRGTRACTNTRIRPASRARQRRLLPASYPGDARPHRPQRANPDGSRRARIRTTRTASPASSTSCPAPSTRTRLCSTPTIRASTLRPSTPPHPLDHRPSDSRKPRSRWRAHPFRHAQHPQDQQ